jgi:hypothetical protein
MVALSAVACTTLIGLPDLPDISSGGAPGGGSSGAEAEAGATSHGGGAPSGGNVGSAGGDSVAAGEAGIPNETGGSGASNVGGAGAGGVSAAGANAGGTSAAGTNAGGAGAGAGGAHAGAGGAGAGSGGTGAGGTSTSAGAGGMNAGGGGGGTKTGPCDIYKTGGTPCVAAHSTVRALFGAYTGKLYQIRNAGGITKDITPISAGGAADAATQDAFCAGTMCGITVVYDQTGKGNDLQYQGADSPVGGIGVPASATKESIKIGGSKAYSLFISNDSSSKNSYWVNGSSNGMPTGAAAEGMYMVTSGKHYNAGCCFDYGNSETDRHADGAGTLDAVYFGSDTAWGTGAGSGPWVMADLEFGLFAQGNSMKNVSDQTQTATFVTAVMKNNGTTEYALKGSDATSGTLSTYYKGALPNGYSPMKKQGAIVLGTGGDCCLSGSSSTQGTFYEGCIVSGYPTDATEDAVQANIVAAGYATSTGL